MKLERKVRLCSAAAAVLIAAIMAAIAGLIIFVIPTRVMAKPVEYITLSGLQGAPDLQSLEASVLHCPQ